jgi:hypothetical protein
MPDARCLLCGRHRLSDEGGDGHWAYASRHRGIGAAPLARLLEVDVSAAFRMEAGIDDDGAALDPIPFDEAGPADRRHDEIGLAYDVG